MLQEGRPNMELLLDLLSGKNGDKISNVKNPHNIAELKIGSIQEGLLWFAELTCFETGQLTSSVRISFFKMFFNSSRS